MQADKLDKLKRLREIRRESAERRYNAAARDSAYARQLYYNAQNLASGVEDLADDDRKSYLKSLFLGNHQQTPMHHSMAVAAYLRTGQQIAEAHDNVGKADMAAKAAEAITQEKRSELLKRENDERKLDNLSARLRLKALRNEG